MRNSSGSVAWSVGGGNCTKPHPLAWLASAAVGIAILLTPPVANADPSCSSIAGGPLCIDGRLQDWGVQLKDSSNQTPQSDWSGAMLAGNRGFMSRDEDTSDLAGNGFYVSPNYGGQNYDFEFLAAAVVGNRLAITAVSGIRPDNGLTYYSPGDFLIKVPSQADPSVQRMYAIEVGGGAPGATAGGPVTTGGLGSDYRLKADGTTQSHSLSSSSTYMLTTQTAGSVWLTHPSNWFLDPFYNCGQNPNDGIGICGYEPVQFRSNTGTVAPTLISANTDYIYTLNSTLQDNGAASLQHSVIELALDLSALTSDYSTGDPLTLEIFWGPSCGNDRLMVALDVQQPNPNIEQLPAPGGLAAFALGLALLGFHRLRRPACR